MAHRLRRWPSINPTLVVSIYVHVKWFPAKGLRIAHLNINHIMGKIDQVKLILDNELPDIFCLGETFSNVKVDDRLLCHEGFELERRDRIAKAGGGLLCYIQNDITL